MKFLSFIYLAGFALTGAVPALAASFRIDFGPLSSSASYKYISTTKLQGWNNVAFAADQTKAGAIAFASNYYGEDKTVTHSSSSSQSVTIYGTDGTVITMSGVKNSSTGKLTMLGGSGAAYAPGSLYQKFDPDADLTAMPSTAYQDFVTTENGASMTLVFSGLEAGLYDISLAAGRTYASGGTVTGASYTLNGMEQTIMGNDGTGGGQYAGMLEWAGVEVGLDGTLSLTVKGLVNEETGLWTAAALNGMVLTRTPESATASMSLLGLACLAFRRRRV